MNKDNTVSTPAFLMISEHHIGVTDNLADVIAYSNDHLQPGESLILKKGYSEDLFIEQQKILTLDNLRNSDGNTVTVPHKQTDFNLVNRKSETKPLLTIVEILK